METATTGRAGTDLREFLRPILTRWPLVLGLAAIIAAGAYYQAQKKETTYKASTQLLLQSRSQVEDLVLGPGGAWSDPDRVAANQAILLTTRGVAERAAKIIGFRGAPESLLGAISVRASESADFLVLSATAPDPQTAVTIANGFAKAFVQSRSAEFRAEAAKAQRTAERQLAALAPSAIETRSQRRDLQGKIQRLELLQSFPVADVKQIDPALGAAADAPQPKRTAVFGFVLGLLLGAGIAYLLELLDRRVTRSVDVEPLYDSRVLVEVPFARKPVVSVDGQSAMAEDIKEPFRSLRTILELEHGGPRSIVVASAVPGEGKSTIVRNLSIAYREAGMRVAAIDADLRAPDLARLFTVDGEVGLMDVLTGAVELRDALQEIPVYAEGLDTMARLNALANGRSEVASPDTWVSHTPTTNGNGHHEPGGLFLLPAGARPANPASVLSSPRFREVLEQIKRTHDVVLIDSPPVLSVSDAVPLLTAVDGVIVTTRLSLTTQSAARQLAEAIRRVPGVNVMGVVANAGDEPLGYYGTPQPRRKLPVSNG